MHTRIKRDLKYYFARDFLSRSHANDGEKGTPDFIRGSLYLIFISFWKA